MLLVSASHQQQWHTPKVGQGLNKGVQYKNWSRLGQPQLLRLICLSDFGSRDVLVIYMCVYIHTHIYKDMLKEFRISLWLWRVLHSCQWAPSQEDSRRHTSQKKRGAVLLYRQNLQWKLAALNYEARLVMYNSLFWWRAMLVAVPSSGHCHSLPLGAPQCYLGVCVHVQLPPRLIPPLTWAAQIIKPNALYKEAA